MEVSFPLINSSDLGRRNPGRNTTGPGVVEIKGTGEDAWVVSDGDQVTRYWGKYRQVLVTNYRDFVLIGQDAEEKPTKLETYRLAPSEKQFWKAANVAKATAERLSESFHEFLKRVLLNTAMLATPEEVAWFLASYDIAIWRATMNPDWALTVHPERRLCVGHGSCG